MRDLCDDMYLVISIHALLAESDLYGLTNFKVAKYFYPRSPCGERRGWTLNINGPMKISIHALLAESDSASYREYMAESISIHALLAESDACRSANMGCP